MATVKLTHAIYVDLNYTFNLAYTICQPVMSSDKAKSLKFMTSMG